MTFENIFVVMWGLMLFLSIFRPARFGLEDCKTGKKMEEHRARGIKTNVYLEIEGSDRKLYI